MITKIVFILYTVIVIGFGISYYSNYQTMKEQSLIIDSLNAKIEIKNMEIEELTNQLNSQNAKIEEYKVNSEEYAKRITILNSELENEISKHYEFEHMQNQNSSEKEAIEWLRAKRNSVSF